MNEKIAVTVKIDIQNGPNISLNRIVEVDAYEKINVSIKNEDADKVVDLWPSDNEGEVVLLAITSNWYGDTITYKVNDVADVYKLDQPHLLIGNSSVNMLDPKPKQLKFSYSKPTPDNKLDSIQIQILIGLKTF
ncbi:hypothetical protein Metho_1610 [Methanomethylovorans hollandica DSM 15978]|uniref:Uncharacterized protein n=1 Tax=Methanomethylovorans hollandica (strain DSM 15978 / NBRC 107637 / DMS1) TaxID=867904 RepID=L0L0P1_METHD|nr:hypothetical protein [Methanomethylovorans hollandica]AGB49804.1 hypothetical protein Metho_1610 [Methanomethylovorans hollandica DSM 15978]